MADMELVIKIPEGATNGDMIKAMFPTIDFSRKPFIDYQPNAVVLSVDIGKWVELRFNIDWWNSPYRKEQE